MDETTIIKSVVNGNAQAYERLAQRYHVDLIIHCERMVNDRQTAEDLAQEAFSIKTSSGQIWRIAYTSGQQATFTAAYSPLKVGNVIALGAEQSIYDLNNRTLDTAHIMFMMRLP